MKILCLLFFTTLAACSTDTKKYSETIGNGEDAVKVRYQKPETNINLPKTAIISCNSECRNSNTQVYEFEHVDANAEEASCKYKFSIPCYPFSCDAKKYSCGTSCSTHEDCAARAICDFESKQCVPAITPAEIAESKAAQRAVSAKKVAVPAPNPYNKANSFPVAPTDANPEVSPAPSASPASSPAATPLPTSAPVLPAKKSAAVKVKPTPEPEIDALPAPAPYTGKLSPEGKE